MPRNLVDPNMSYEQKVERLIKIAERLARRSNKVSEAIITPYPVSNCIVGESVYGEILHYMFACSGVILKGGLFLDHKPKDTVSIELSTTNKSGSISKSYNVNKQANIIEPNIEVSDWDRLVISMIPSDAEENFTKVWVGILWVPSIDSVSIERFLIDALDKQTIEDL